MSEDIEENGDGSRVVTTADGSEKHANVSDYILRAEDGTFDVVPADIFAATYQAEPVDGSADAEREAATEAA
jgi:hypothetical protein